MDDGLAQESPEVYGNQIPKEVHPKSVPRTSTPLPITLHMGEIGLSAYCVYQALLTYINRPRGDKIAWPSKTALMKITGLGHSTLEKAMRRLKELKLVEIKQMRKGDGGYGTNYYLIDDDVPIEWSVESATGCYNLADGTGCYNLASHNLATKFFPGFKLDPEDLKKEVSYGDCSLAQNTRSKLPPPPKPKVAKRPAKVKKPLPEDDELLPVLRDHLPKQIPLEWVNDVAYWDTVSFLAHPAFLDAKWLRTQLAQMSLWLDSHPSKSKRSERGWREFMTNWFKRSLSRGA